MRTVYHFFDKLENINEVDGNAFCGTTAGGGIASGLDDALDIHPVSDGGFPTMDSYAATLSNGHLNSKLRSNGLQDGVVRKISKATRDSLTGASVLTSTTDFSYTGFIYAKVQNGVNNAVIDGSGNVNQLSRSWDDICKDRLYFSGKANLCVGIPTPDISFVNKDYYNYAHVLGRGVIIPFLNPTTGKIVGTPKARWQNSITNASTDDIIGLVFYLSISRGFNGQSHIGIDYYGVSLYALTSTGVEILIKSNAFRDNTETTAERDAKIRNKIFELYLRNDGLYRFVIRDRATQSIDTIHGDSSYNLGVSLFPDDNIGLGSQTTPFVFGLGAKFGFGSDMTTNHQDYPVTAYNFTT